MRKSVTTILSEISSTVNLDYSVPTGDELTLWMGYLNRAYQEWSESHDWEELRKIFFPTAVSGATVPLPLDYRKLAAPVRLHNAGDASPAGFEFPDIMFRNEDQHNTTDRYIKILGDISGGKSVLFNPATLASGASLEIQYFSMPTSLASPADIPIVPDGQFLVDRVTAFIYESRGDGRFQQSEVKARQRLLTMIENSNAAVFNSYDHPEPVQSTMQKLGWRVGRD